MNSSFWIFQPIRFVLLNLYISIELELSDFHPIWAVDFFLSSNFCFFKFQPRTRVSQFSHRARSSGFLSLNSSFQNFHIFPIKFELFKFKLRVRTLNFPYQIWAFRFSCRTRAFWFFTSSLSPEIFTFNWTRSTQKLANMFEIYEFQSEHQHS